MDSLKKLDALWGTNLYNIEIDYFLNSIKFYIKFLEGNIFKFYELAFEKIIKLEINNERTYPRQNLELTEIHSSKDDNYHFSILIWNESYTMDIECENWKLNLLEEFDESR